MAHTSHSASSSRKSLSRDTVEAELDYQILMSERLSAGALSIVLTALIIALLIGWFASYIRGDVLPGLPWRILLLGGSIGYEVLAFFILKRFTTEGRSLHNSGRFLNAFIETSFPTLLILNIAANSGPILALNSAATYFYFLFIILSALRLNPLLCVFTGLVAAVEYGVLTLWHWDSIKNNFNSNVAWFVFILRALTFLVAGLTAAFVSMQIRKRLFETLRAVKERSEVVDMFGMHVTPEVVETLLAQGVDDAVETTDVCIMVLDIRGFTTFSEHRTPDEAVAYLNTLWELCVGIVNQHKGTVNKFLGDGFMAVFGAPLIESEYRGNAVAAAKEIISAVNQQVAAGNIPPTRIGIGLHAGPALVGSIGSAERKEYTVIGDVVNVAFRIEELNKRFDSMLLISDTVYESPEVGENQSAIKLESLQVKGRNQSVQIFKLA